MRVQGRTYDLNEVATSGSTQGANGNGREPGTRFSAFGYMSVSAASRIDDQELARQAAAIEEFCASRGWPVVALVRDIGPPNGKGSTRPALAYAIEHLTLGDASCLVVAELKRLCPSVAELGGILAAVDNAEARLVSLHPPVDTSTALGCVAAQLLTAVSGWERDRRRERTSAARATSAIPPTIQPPLRRRIVSMRRDGMTLWAIANSLNEEGVPTVRGGKRWRPSSVQAALGYKRPLRW
jgi:DNA invertase Pin-like site-specific DNA recombinase